MFSNKGKGPGLLPALLLFLAALLLPGGTGAPAHAADVPAIWELMFGDEADMLSTPVYLGDGKIVYRVGNTNIRLLDTATGGRSLLAAGRGYRGVNVTGANTISVVSPGEFYFVTYDSSALCHYANSQMTDLTPAELGYAGYEMAAVDGSGADNVYLVMRPPSGQPYLLLRYDGSAWSPVDLSGIPGYDAAADTLSDVCLPGENIVYLFWRDASDGNARKLSYYNGSAWSEVAGYSATPSRVGKHLPTGRLLVDSSDRKLRVFQAGSQVQELDLPQAGTLSGGRWFATAGGYTYLVDRGIFRYDGSGIEQVAPPVTSGALWGIAVDEEDTLYLATSDVMYKTVRDLTPPAFAEGYPRAENLSASGFDLRFALDKPGTVYYQVVVRDADPGGDYESWLSASAGAEAAGVTVGGLAPATGYDVYLIAKDNLGNWQEAPFRLPVTTLDAASDTTPPAFAAGYPRAAHLTPAGFDLQVKLDESGTVYYRAVPDGEPITPADGQSVAQAVYLHPDGSISVSGLDEYVAAITSLADKTAYDVYVVAADAVGNLQAEPVKLDVTTRRFPVFTQAPETEAVYSNSIAAAAQAQTDAGLYDYGDGLNYDYARSKYLLLEGGAAAPSVETVLSQGTNDGVSSTSSTSGGIRTVNFMYQVTGLQPGHSYDMYVILVTDSGILQQEEPYKLAFTTTQRLDGYTWRKAGQAGGPAGVLANIGGARFLTDDKILDLDSGAETALGYTVTGAWVRSEDDFFYAKQDGSRYRIMHSVAGDVYGVQMECEIAGPRHFAGDGGGVYAFGSGLALFNEADGSWDEIAVDLPAAEFYSGACTPGYLYLGGRLSAEPTPVLYRYNRNSGAWADIPLPPYSALDESGIRSYVREIWALGDEDLAAIGTERQYIYRYRDGTWKGEIRRVASVKGAKALNIGPGGGYVFIMQIGQIGDEETALYLDGTGWRDMEALEETSFQPAAACTGLDGNVYVLGQSQGSYSVYRLSRLAAGDTQPPVITTSARNETVNQSGYTFTVSAYDEVDGNLKPVVKLGGADGTVLAGTSQGGGVYSYTAQLAEGQNIIYLTAVDDSGNRAEKTFTVTYDPAAGDTAPPVFDSNYPRTANVTASGFHLLIRLDEPGTAYYKAVADGSEPGSDYVSWTAVPIPSADEVSAAVGGLTAGTAYDVHVIARDTAGNWQAAPVQLEVTTLEDTSPAPPGFAEGYPLVANITAGGFDLRVKLSVAGAVYYKTVAGGTPITPEPGQTVAQAVYQNHDGSLSLPALQEGGVTIGGLTADTAYDVYLVVRDTAGSLQEEPAKLEVTTDGFSIERVGEGGFTLGTDANVTVKMTNNTGASQQATLIVCLYDNASTGMISYAYVSREVLDGEEVTMSGGFPIPETGDFSVKALVWDTFENMEPLLENPLVMDVS